MGRGRNFVMRYLFIEYVVESVECAFFLRFMRGLRRFWWMLWKGSGARRGGQFAD